MKKPEMRSKEALVPTRREMLACTAALLASASSSTWAQAWPAKPVKLIVPYAPGGTIDIIARRLSEELARAFGQAVVVENHAGAGGVVGTEYVLKQPADGYTILLTTVSHTLTPSLQKLSFDAENDFVPVVHIADSAQVLFKNPAFAPKSLRELIQLAKQTPGALNYAHGGNGSPANIAAELLKAKAGVDIVAIPYKGAGPVVSEVLAGHVRVGVTSQPAVQAQLASGALVALGVSTSRRAQSLPDVPTFAEQGVAGYEFDTWFGFLVARGTPPAIIGRIVDATNAALRRPDVKESLTAQGADPAGGTAEDFDRLLKREFQRWPRELKEAGIS
jgi:tripartite-type tricarboxylate transporter receptor subunit TctC